jgi:hypothetical protein
MGFLTGRDGKISVVRVGTIVAIIGVLFVAGGFAAFQVDQNSFKAPLEVAPYPSAEEWGEDQVSLASRTLFYRVKDASPEEVAAYYQQKLNEFSGGGSEKCVRIPSAGEFPDSRRPGVVPYEITCLFERTSLNVSQTTIVKIQPGVANDDPELNTLGMTVISHDQRWQP